MHAADGCPVSARRDLDVDADHPLDVSHQFGQRRRQPTPQAVQLVAQRGQRRRPSAE